MTDTQTMREMFEKTTRLPLKRNLIYKDQYDDMATEDAWFCFQAAWTRKPAAQVAGAEMVPVEYQQRMIAPNGNVGVWHLASKEVFDRYSKNGDVGDGFLYEVRALYTHPAPEPDVTKVVSVPGFDVNAAWDAIGAYVHASMSYHETHLPASTLEPRRKAFDEAQASLKAIIGARTDNEVKTS